MEEKSKVYIRLDSDHRIIGCDGGYSVSNIRDFADWYLIDEGVGDRYNLCQSCYLEKPLTDDRGIYRYKYIGGEIIERSKEEMDADYFEVPELPTQLDFIEAQVMYTALMTDTLLEVE